jgi:hypothetical protein
MENIASWNDYKVRATKSLANPVTKLIRQDGDWPKIC